jgi:hypothetical protein
MKRALVAGVAVALVAAGGLRPGQANQRGWFYPAHGAAPAVFAVMVDGTERPRLAPRRALSILARHGIPIRR